MFVMETCDHRWVDDGDNQKMVCLICGESHSIDFAGDMIFFDEDFAAALRTEFAEDTQ